MVFIVDSTIFKHFYIGILVLSYFFTNIVISSTTYLIFFCISKLTVTEMKSTSKIGNESVQ